MWMNFSLIKTMETCTLNNKFQQKINSSFMNMEWNFAFIHLFKMLEALFYIIIKPNHLLCILWKHYSILEVPNILFKIK